MSDALAGSVADAHRSRNGCLCCGSATLSAETTVISPFIARRALATEPQLTKIVFCPQCGFRFFDRGLSASEEARYYAGYRSDAYRAERNRFEPFYTAKAHREVAAFLGSKERRNAVATALTHAGAPARFESALDFGGGDGTLISDIPAAERMVFDLAGLPPVAGVRLATTDDVASRRWDLIVCAQVLEHISDPRATMAQLAGLLTPGGWLYLEVPDEIWTNRTFAGRLRDRWLGWLISKRRLLIAADTLSTACRVLLGFLPPFGFIPMREHLQYFTTNALVALVRTGGLHVVRSGSNAVGQIHVVATRAHPATDAAAAPRPNEA